MLYLFYRCAHLFNYNTKVYKSKYKPIYFEFIALLIVRVRGDWYEARVREACLYCVIYLNQSVMHEVYMSTVCSYTIQLTVRLMNLFGLYQSDRRTCKRNLCRHQLYKYRSFEHSMSIRRMSASTIYWKIVFCIKKVPPRNSRLSFLTWRLYFTQLCMYKGVLTEK